MNNLIPQCYKESDKKKQQLRVDSGAAFILPNWEQVKKDESLPSENNTVWTHTLVDE